MLKQRNYTENEEERGKNSDLGRLHSRRKRGCFRHFSAPESAIFCTKIASVESLTTRKQPEFTFLEAFCESKFSASSTTLRDFTSRQVITLPLRSNEKKAAAQKIVQLLFLRKIPSVTEAETEASDDKQEQVLAVMILPLPHSTEASSVKYERDQFPEEISWRSTHIVQAFGLCIHLSKF